MGDTAGTPRTRALAAALRRARTTANFGVREVARRLEISHTTISQWETGKRVPHPDDVASMLAVIGVTGKRRDEILDISRNAAERNWLTTGADGVSHQLAGLLECERTATEIVEWAPFLIPGLLQTADYARAIIGADPRLSRAEIEARVQRRLDRRVVLTEDREDRPPADYTALIGECVLRQRVGGVGVLAEQCRQLLKLAALPAVTLLVVRIGDGWHPGLAGPFVLYNFDQAPSIVHLEHHRSSAFLFDEPDVPEYKLAVAEIRRVALEPDESAAYITEMISGLEKRE